MLFRSETVVFRLRRQHYVTRDIAVAVDVHFHGIARYEALDVEGKERFGARGGSEEAELQVARSELWNAVEVPAYESEAAFVRFNIGMDFGAWRMALRRLNLPRPDTRRILLINDSVYGPVAPLQPLLERMDTDTADLWGMTDSREIAWHVQSYFLLAGPRLIHSATWRRFWAMAVPLPWRRWVIRRHEIGLSRRVVADGFTTRALFPARSGANPMFADWRELLSDGFPFLKRELLRDNPTADPGIAAWRQLVAEPFVREIERDLGRWKKS